MSRDIRVPVAFEIIVQHFSCKPQPIENTQTEIYEIVKKRYYSVNAYIEPVPKKDDVKKTLTYLNHFGLVEVCHPQPCWHIKPVEEMCDWLRGVSNRNIENDNQEFTIPIAFEIIIKDFSRDTGWHITTDIEKHVFNVHKEQGGLPPKPLKDPLVNRTLRFMNYFGFAEKNGRSDWRIKSVDDMCNRLRDLDPNRNLSN